MEVFDFNNYFNNFFSTCNNGGRGKDIFDFWDQNDLDWEEDDLDRDDEERERKEDEERERKKNDDDDDKWRRIVEENFAQEIKFFSSQIENLDIIKTGSEK